jgi:alpha-glucosidase
MQYGKRTDYQVMDNRVTVSFEQQTVVIEIIRDDIVNFFVPRWSRQHYSKAIEGNKAKPTAFQVSEQEGKLLIETDKLRIFVEDDFLVDIFSANGKCLLRDYRGEVRNRQRLSEKTLALVQAEGHEISAETDGTRPVQTFKCLGQEDCFYGLGDKTGFLNKRGYEYENWNSDIPQAHNEDYHALYKSIPFLLCKKKDAVYGLFFDNTFHSYLNLGKSSEGYYSYEADDGNLDYYFLAGETLADVIGSYTYLTGTTPLPQLWTLGYQQCRWGYENEHDIREVANKYRELQIPCESVQYDIDYMQGYKVFTWDEKNYGKPGELFRELGEKGFKPVVIIDPGTKMEAGYMMYEEGVKNGYFATTPDGEVYVNEVWPGEANYPDFGRKEVRDWWGEHIRFLTDMGVQGIWNDMNEPASFRGELPKDVVFHDEDRTTNHAEMHNVYGHYMSKATFDGLKKLTPKRPFVITRACYAGSQKYATVWTGDNQSLWSHLQMMVPQLCNLGMSGFSIAGVDIGGFGADTTPELLTRWIEAAAFSTFFRNHSANGSRRQEPWQFSDEVVDIYRKYVNLHYRFLPYIYDLLYKGETTGLPVMRPLVLHYEDDPETYNLNGEFLVGESLLVAPVLEQGATKKLVYLPDGVWYDYWTGERLEGRQYMVVDAPLDHCPIYVKGGSIIPMYEQVQYVGERPYDKLMLLTTPEAAEYEHFQDNGEDYAYKKGAYNLYHFSKEEHGPIEQELLHKGYPEYAQIETICIC